MRCFLFGFASVAVVSACATGVADGPPDVTETVTGSVEIVSQCVMSELKLSRRDSSCSPQNLSLQEYYSAGRAIIDCAIDTSSAWTGDSQHTRYTIAFDQTSSDQVVIGIWQNPTVPGVTSYANRLSPVIQACDQR